MKLEQKKRALVIVAHPDDETIWMGGTIIDNPGVHWTIFSLCRSGDRDRAPKFKKVCKFYGAKSWMTNMDDEDKLTLDSAVASAKRLITLKTKNKKFDYVFTHGANGEYGHDRHVATHLAVSDLVGKGKLKCDKLWYLHYHAYSKGNKTLIKPAKKYSDLKKLIKQTFRKKVGVMTDIYGFDPEGIDVGYATEQESFILNK